MAPNGRANLNLLTTLRTPFTTNGLRHVPEKPCPLRCQQETSVALDWRSQCAFQVKQMTAKAPLPQETVKSDPVSTGSLPRIIGLTWADAVR
jgi:hypothetical protein